MTAVFRPSIICRIKKILEKKLQKKIHKKTEAKQPPFMEILQSWERTAFHKQFNLPLTVVVDNSEYE